MQTSFSGTWRSVVVAATGDGDALFGAFALNGVNQAVLPRDPARPPPAQGSLKRLGLTDSNERGASDLFDENDDLGKYLGILSP